MVTIITRFSGPTNTKGSRIIAQRSDWKPGYPKGTRITISRDHAAVCPHWEAARQLATGLNWAGTWIAGDTPNGRCFVGVPYGTLVPAEYLIDGQTAFVVTRKEGVTCE